MAAAGTSYDIVPFNYMDIEEALQLLTDLILQGSASPVRLAEFALRSAIASDLVEILCLIRRLPLTFAYGGFVSASDGAFMVFGEFVKRAVACQVPRNVQSVPGLRRGSQTISLVYSRKRKAQSMGSAVALLPSSKRSLLTLDRGMPAERSGVGKSIETDGHPKLLSLSNEIPCKVSYDIASSSRNDWLSVGINSFDCNTARLDPASNLPVPLHNLNCFESRNIGYFQEEDTKESASNITNSVITHKKVVDFLFEYNSLDDEVDNDTMKEQALQRLAAVEADFRSLLDLSSPENQTLGEVCTSLSLRSGITSEISETCAFEKINTVEPGFETFSKDHVLDHSALHPLDYKPQVSLSPLPYNNQLVVEAINEMRSRNIEDRLITSQQDQSALHLQNSNTQNSFSGFPISNQLVVEAIDEMKLHYKEDGFITCQLDQSAQHLLDSNIQNSFSQLTCSNQLVETIDERKLACKDDGLIIDKKNQSALHLVDSNTQNSISQILCSNQPVAETIDGIKLPSKDDALIINQQDKSALHPQDSNTQNSISWFPCSNQLVVETIDDMKLPHKEDMLIITQQDKSALHPQDSNAQNSVSQLPCSNQLVETIDEMKLPYNDDGLVIGQKDKPAPHLLDSNTQNLSSPLPCSNPLVVDVINETNLLHKDDKIITHQLDQSAQHLLDSNTQNSSPSLPCSNQLMVEAIDETKLQNKNDRAITEQLDKNNTAADSRTLYCDMKDESMLTKTSAAIGDAVDSAEGKQRIFREHSIKDIIAPVGVLNLVDSRVVSKKTSSTKDEDQNIEVGLIGKQKEKKVFNADIPLKDNKVDSFAKSTKNSTDKKLMPDFESFIIKEEEGSGGYGTVYKAQRKEDGKIFAIKCPHANAHTHHINNELKMLERFGGRNFVIKYEGSFKNGDLECFVLEHVQHDRPEILKKEIGMFELQWYGFCMFRALASLHKQGVVHRDVKPGNFLFSRKLNKGYLIDFNLASDLHQKFCRSGKRKMPCATGDSISLAETKSASIIHSRKFTDRGLLEHVKKEAANESKKDSSSKNSKKKPHKGDADGFPIFDRSRHGSQTADGSGVTSTKDQTSNKTPVDWLKQPIPLKGRKELINFVHRTMNNPQNLEAVSNGPCSQRKRVAAPMTKTDARLLIHTPMPLHSGGNAGAGMLKNKGCGKVKREGPCVGTKGFRAPEVLFKSFYQGCKIDVWSAGVTMLYFMIGRAPFGGDPEQNIKDIAKLRGSEDLWEVAKLHDCEPSFPVELLNVESLKSMDLRDWCSKNTRRAEFLELIPHSLFDLIDKCLAVNPRRRLSAEEALMHRFFAPCHESIRKQRLLRKVSTFDP